MFDLYIAFALIGTIIVLFLLSRMKILPKKTLPFIAAAILAGFGIALFRRYRENRLLAELKRLEDEVKEREARVRKLKASKDASEERLRKMKVEFEKARAAYEKAILRIEKDKKEEIERINNLSGDELHDEFGRLLGEI